MNDQRPEHILRWFSYAHLPEHIQPTSKIFADLAAVMMVMCENGSAERTVAFRKLLECKDAYVRACIESKEKSE